MTDVERLNHDFGRSDAVAFAASPLGGPVAHLEAGGDRATVALYGAQVLNWEHRGAEQLWLSPHARLGTGKGVRGGIPVCWPWFGPHDDDAAKPAHGFVRVRDWRVDATASGDDHASITLSFATRPEMASVWPHDAQVALTVRLGDGLSLRLETANTGRDPFVLGEALHTYFAVTDIGEVEITGLDGIDYIDKLDDNARKRQVGPVTVGEEVDRIYVGETGNILLRDGARRLGITSAGSRSAVVWNPWIAKSRRLGDMGAPDAFRHMMCIETANAGSDRILLKPGERHVLEARYRIA